MFIFCLFLQCVNIIKSNGFNFQCIIYFLLHVLVLLNLIFDIDHFSPLFLLDFLISYFYNVIYLINLNYSQFFFNEHYTKQPSLTVFYLNYAFPVFEFVREKQMWIYTLRKLLKTFKLRVNTLTEVHLQIFQTILFGQNRKYRICNTFVDVILNAFGDIFLNKIMIFFNFQRSEMYSIGWKE